MSKVKEYIKETIGLIDRIEHHMPRIDNLFDIFEYSGKIALSEGVLKSYDASFIISSLMKKFNLTTNINEFLKGREFDGYIRIDYARQKPKNALEFYRGGKPVNEEIVILEILLPEGNYSERVKKFMDVCGWYLAYSEPYGKKEGFVLNVFEKKIQSKGGVKINETGNLYHLIPTSRIEKIKYMGLCPKSGCKLGFHPDRIYFFNEELSDNEIFNWISQLSATEKNSRTINKGYTLLQINTEGLNADFYADPNLDDAVYTTDNIPIENIKIIKKYDRN